MTVFLNDSSLSHFPLLSGSISSFLTETTYRTHGQQSENPDQEGLLETQTSVAKWSYFRYNFTQPAILFNVPFMKSDMTNKPKCPAHTLSAHCKVIGDCLNDLYSYNRRVTVTTPSEPQCDEMPLFRWLINLFFNWKLCALRLWVWMQSKQLCSGIRK